MPVWRNLPCPIFYFEFAVPSLTHFNFLVPARQEGTFYLLPEPLSDPKTARARQIKSHQVSLTIAFIHRQGLPQIDLGQDRPLPLLLGGFFRFQILLFFLFRIDHSYLHLF